MVNEAKLSMVLSDFARTLITDFPIQGILDHLVERIVDVLPVTAAGVTLISEGMAPRYIAASDESALLFERLQTEIRQGPCLLAYKFGEAVMIPDLVADERFPRFAEGAVAAGLAAVFTFPLRHGEGRLGALDLYRDTPGELDEHDFDAAQTLADVTAAYLLNAQARDDARAASDRFHHSALHDPLTGLANRLLLHERLEHAALRAKRTSTTTAILFADLDRFKQINDTYGHAAGDELLIAVGHRLSGLVRSGDTLARFSGDEFVFLCEDLHATTDIEVLAQRIDNAFSIPFPLPNAELEVSITASVGMASAGPGEIMSHQLVVQADLAMYQVKRKGGNGHQIVDELEAMQTSSISSLENDLREALANAKLRVAYQPIVRCDDGLVIGVEALLRWHHPERGQVSPMSIIDVAEQSGLINEIGAWVLESSCRERVRWMGVHPDLGLDMAVNVSARQLISPGFRATVETVLTNTGMDPNALILEMTENIFIEDSERVMRVLTDLSELGIRLALDDFGTGYSSLSYLDRLPIHVVKIDQRFIAKIGYLPGKAIVAAVTDLAHTLGFAVVAEGVETRGQRDAVSSVGCEFAQGFYFARPMPASAMDAQLETLAPGLLHLPGSRNGAARAG